MATYLTNQTLTPARHKIALPPSREKLLPTGHKKPVVSRRPALFFIRGIQTLPNAPFFPPTPPSLRPHFGAPIATLSTQMAVQASATPQRSHQPASAAPRAIIGESDG
jgi:hypothetical protein